MKKFFILTLFLMSLILLLASCAHTHEFGEWSQATLPTCTSEGIMKRICECGEIEEQTIPETDHVAGKASCTEELLCTVCGEVIGPKLDHVVEDSNSCTKWRACKLCGTTVQAAPGHDWTEANCLTAKSCRKCNETEGLPLGHQWVAGSPTCQVCGTERTAFCISGDAKEAQAAELYYIPRNFSVVGGSVAYETTDKAMNVIWKPDANIKANIKDFPIVLILTANLCTCDYDGACLGEEDCSLNLTVSGEQIDPADLKVYFFDRPYGWFNYFYYDYSSEIAKGLSGTISDIRFAVNGIEHSRENGGEKPEIYFIGFFKTLEEAEHCAGRYLATMWATEE